MNKLTKDDYVSICEALRAKGYSVETKREQSKLFKDLEKSNFQVRLKGKTYQVYASRIIAMMHETSEDSPLEL